MYYIKRGLVILVVVAVLGIVFLPYWTSVLAQRGFLYPDASWAPGAVRQAVRIKRMVYLYSDVESICERALEVFPQSPHRAFFLYNASLAAEKNEKPEKAIRYAEQFISEYPQHQWRSQASARVRKMRELTRE